MMVRVVLSNSLGSSCWDSPDIDNSPIALTAPLRVTFIDWKGTVVSEGG